jgi:hypothetical protein
MRFRRAGLSVAIAGVYAILNVFFILVRHGHPTHRLAVFFIGIGLLSLAVNMLVQLAYVVSLARIRMNLLSSLMLTLASAVVLAATYSPIKIASFAAAIAFVLLRELSLVTLAAGAGYAVSFVIREPNLLLPVGICAAIVDFWGVNWGFVHRTLVTAPQVVRTVSVPVRSVLPSIPLTTIGSGDFVFLALFFGVLYRFDMNVKWAFWVGYALLLVSMLAVMLVGPIPALVPMAIAVLVTNWNRFKLSRQEKASTAIVAGVLITLLTLATLKRI